jgi:hypothetical protein
VDVLQQGWNLTGESDHEHMCDEEESVEDVVDATILDYAARLVRFDKDIVLVAEFSQNTL